MYAEVLGTSTYRLNGHVIGVEVDTGERQKHWK